MKVAVLGYSGSGKSTVARKLGEKLSVPVLHLDTVFWLPGWNERDRAECADIAARFMEQDSWLIEGVYSKLHFHERMEQADRIILVTLPRLNCLIRAVRRYYMYRGVSRPDMTEGCPEKFDLDFAWWVVWKGRTKPRRRILEDVIACYPEKVTILRSQRQIDRFLEGFHVSQTNHPLP